MKTSTFNDQGLHGEGVEASSARRGYPLRTRYAELHDQDRLGEKTFKAADGVIWSSQERTPQRAFFL
jgi:hypothetical protein